MLVCELIKFFFLYIILHIFPNVATSITRISIISDMEESIDFFDQYDTNRLPFCDKDQAQHPEDADEVECLRRKIKFYFMNPCEKYHARGRKPWKLMLQIVKIAIITIQVKQSAT